MLAVEGVRGLADRDRDAGRQHGEELERAARGASTPAETLPRPAVVDERGLVMLSRSVVAPTVGLPVLNADVVGSAVGLHVCPMPVGLYVMSEHNTSHGSACVELARAGGGTQCHV